MDHTEFSDLSKVPNPATDMNAFQRWITHIEENDLFLEEDILSEIALLPYSVFKPIVEQISVSATILPYIADMAATEMLANNQATEAITFLEVQLSLQTKEQLPWHKNVLHQIYLSLVIAGSRSTNVELVDKYFNMIEDNWAKFKAQVYRWITLIDKNLHNTQALFDIKRDIEAFLELHQSQSSDTNYGWLGMAYLCFQQGDLEACQRALQEINYEFDVIAPFAQKTVGHLPELWLMIEREVTLKNSWLETHKRLERTALKISTVKMPASVPSSKHFYFYVHKQVDMEKLLWVHPVSEQHFIGCTKAGCLFVAEISPEHEINMLQTIQLQDAISFACHHATVYVSCFHSGILRFALKDNRLHKEETIVNRNRMPRYRALALQGDLLYASNFNQLEVFKLLPEGYELVSERVYIGNQAFTLFVKDTLALVSTGSDRYIWLDISDPKNPQYLSMILNLETGQSGYVHWSQDQLIGSAIIDLENPVSPRLVFANGDRIAAFYNFSTIFPDDCISSECKGVIKAIPPIKGFKAAQPLFNCYEANKKRDFIPFENLASAITDDTLIVFDKRKITILRKEEV